MTGTISLSQATPQQVLDAFMEAFSDYAVGFTREEIERMLERRGYKPALSIGAVADGRIVAFILNGYGSFQGEKTCYDCGTGTVPAYRGKGFAGKLFEQSIPTLREAGVRNYLLEVLCDNEAAIKVYRNAGFKVCANYDCYNQAVGNLNIKARTVANPDIRTLDPDKLGTMEMFTDFTPSWQNSLESISRGRDGLKIKGAFLDNEAVGFCVTDPSTGDLTQIAVRQDVRRRGIGTALLANALTDFRAQRIKALNIEASCKSLTGFLSAMNFEKGLSQFAMMRPI